MVASRSSGTRVAGSRNARAVVEKRAIETDLQSAMYQHFLPGPAVFQMGVPASDCFPATLLARIRARAARDEAEAIASYHDPRGEFEFRREIAAHLALSRGIECLPSQVFITAGFSGGLGAALQVIRAAGKTAWVENPGFLLSRRALEISGLSAVHVPVDADGMDVAYGERHAPHAAIALVTPGQQAPLGPTLPLERRLQLIAWAKRSQAWIIEDDYLGELQLKRRAAPALAAQDTSGRVIHIGSFAKTISPALRLGFVVAPPALVPAFDEVMACLAPAPGSAVQIATLEFMRDGHYLRHLRRMKRIYAVRSNALIANLNVQGLHGYAAGLAVVVQLPDGCNDKAIAREAFAYGIAPAPLSIWYGLTTAQRSGLLLGVATAVETQQVIACQRLAQIIRKFS